MSSKCLSHQEMVYRMLSMLYPKFTVPLLCAKTNNTLPAAGSDPPFTKTIFSRMRWLEHHRRYWRAPLDTLFILPLADDDKSEWFSKWPTMLAAAISQNQLGIIEIKGSKPATLRKAKQLHETCDSTELVEVLQTTIYSLDDCGWSQRRIASELVTNPETVRRYLRLAKPAIRSPRIQGFRLRVSHDETTDAARAELGFAGSEAPSLLKIAPLQYHGALAFLPSGRTDDLIPLIRSNSH